MVFHKNDLKNRQKLSFILFLLMPAFYLLKLLTPLLLSFLKGKVYYSLVQSFPFIDLMFLKLLEPVMKMTLQICSVRTKNFIFTTLSIKGTAQYHTSASRNLQSNR